MIPPRARRFLTVSFISRTTIRRGERAGRMLVGLARDVKVNAGHVRALDLRMLERKGLITYELDQRFTDLFGVMTWDVKLTDAGAEEIADDYAKQCAEADAHNEKLRNPDPFGDRWDQVDEQRSDAAMRAEARTKQREEKRR